MYYWDSLKILHTDIMNPIMQDHALLGQSTVYFSEYSKDASERHLTANHPTTITAITIRQKPPPPATTDATELAEVVP